MIYVIRNNIGGKHDFQRSCNAGIWWIDNTQGFAINGLTTLFFYLCPLWFCFSQSEYLLITSEIKLTCILKLPLEYMFMLSFNVNLLWNSPLLFASVHVEELNYHQKKFSGLSLDFLAMPSTAVLG